MAKHDYKGRLSALNKTIGFLLEDYIERYDLKEGDRCRVETDAGKFIYGFFNHLKVSVFANKVDIWISLYKIKKDGTPSKVDTGHHLSRVKEIVNLPF